MKLSSDFVRLIFFSLITSLSCVAQNLAPDIANYDISVILDNEKKILNGEQQLTWLNTSPIAVNELQFHLYLNAFKDNKSTFMKESGGRLRGDKMPPDGYGNIYVTRFSSMDGQELLGKLKYIQPDDENEDDRTVISVELEKPVEPGESIVLNMGFRAKLPKIFARTGYGENDYYLIGQWFPKIGVFEPNEDGEWGWNCHQFHANSEFYADFGEYKVNITLDQKLKVGASGELISELKLKDGLKSVSYKASDVHDFAWTASPDFVIHETEWKGVKVKAMMQPEHASQYKRYFDGAIRSLEYTEKLLGKYPHKTLTLVDPPISSEGSAGMEYPTFVTGLSYWGVGKWLRLAELVVVHEFGHQYFQGILANNEFEQAFLDEGFNQYLEGRIMDESYGKGSLFNLLGFTIRDSEISRYSYVTMKFPEMDKINRPVWKYPKGVYSDLTYTKTATVLMTLENLIGREQMDAVLKSYYQQYKFKHPKLADFSRVLNETTGANYQWFVDQAFNKNYSCDYQVDTLINSGKQSSFVLSRKGQFILPQQVLVRFNDGSEEVFVWDAQQINKKFSFDKLISQVSIDPGKRNLMDLNRVNNSYTVLKQDDFFAKYTAKAIFWIQHIVIGFLFWIG